MYKMLIVLPTVILALAACTPPDVTNCTEEARASVVIDVQDADGNPIEDADVVYTVDGGAEQDCETFEPGSYVCGYEVEGTIEVFVLTDDDEASTSFDIESDACHVIGQSATVVLGA